MRTALTGVLTRCHSARIVFAFVCWAIAASPASAQERWEAWGGYAFMHDTQDDLHLPAGWAAGTGATLTRWLSVVVDASGHYRTVPLVGGDVRVSTHALMAGGRASAKIGNVIEFGQLLAGAVHTTGTAFGQSSVETHLGLQAGGGLDVKLRRALTTRVQLDARFLRTGPQIRVVAALVFAGR